MRHAALALAAALAACGSSSTQLVGWQVEPMTVTAVDYPKHFSVDLRDNSGRVWRGVARSKHCNGARTRVFPGMTLQVPLQQLIVDGQRVERVMGGQLNQMLCGH